MIEIIILMDRKIHKKSLLLNVFNCRIIYIEMRYISMVDVHQLTSIENGGNKYNSKDTEKECER